MFNKDSFTN